jgi:hypothetical protein
MNWRNPNDFFSLIKFFAVEIGATVIFVVFVAREVWHVLVR